MVPKGWTQPEPLEEYTTIKLERSDRYGRIMWLTGRENKYFSMIAYDFGTVIQSPISFVYFGDAVAWVEQKIDLPPGCAIQDHYNERPTLLTFVRGE